MLICPAIGDTDPIRYHRPTPDGQFSGNIFYEAMRPLVDGVERVGDRSSGGVPGMGTGLEVQVLYGASW